MLWWNTSLDSLKPSFKPYLAVSLCLILLKWAPHLPVEFIKAKTILTLEILEQVRFFPPFIPFSLHRLMRNDWKKRKRDEKWPLTSTINTIHIFHPCFYFGVSNLVLAHLKFQQKDINYIMKNGKQLGQY